MSKGVARKPKSYENEERLFHEAVRVVAASGFESVAPRKDGSVKLIDARARDGSRVCFWLKLGWSDVPYAAIQFGLFAGPDGSNKSNAEFVAFVRDRVQSMKIRGATHALLFHRGVLALALPIDEVVDAYGEQMHRFPRAARNTKSATMWFFDPRPSAKPELTEIVRRKAIPLDVLAKHAQATANDPEARSRMAEVEVRVAQAVFRNRVGERCGWRCVITGSVLRETLEAAHLPGRDWRLHNEAVDGVLLRADIHRLVDQGLARIEDGVFRLEERARSEYGKYEGTRISAMR
jgi:hypothetical protein